MNDFNFHKVEYFKKGIFVFDIHLYEPLKKKITNGWVHKSYYFKFPSLHKNERIDYSIDSFWVK